jgi:hypothetical protein
MAPTLWVNGALIPCLSIHGSRYSTFLREWLLLTGTDLK